MTIALFSCSLLSGKIIIRRGRCCSPVRCNDLQRSIASGGDSTVKKAVPRGQVYRCWQFLWQGGNGLREAVCVHAADTETTLNRLSQMSPIYLHRTTDALHRNFSFPATARQSECASIYRAVSQWSEVPARVAAREGRSLGLVLCVPH